MDGCLHFRDSSLTICLTSFLKNFFCLLKHSCLYRVIHGRVPPHHVLLGGEEQPKSVSVQKNCTNPPPLVLRLVTKRLLSPTKSNISANSNQSVLVFSDRLFEASKHLSENAVSLNTSFTKQELKSAYRKRALETHPDSGGTASAFREVLPCLPSSFGESMTLDTSWSEVEAVFRTVENAVSAGAFQYCSDKR